MIHKFLNIKNGKIYEFFCKMDFEKKELELFPQFMIYIGKDDNNEFIRLTSNRLVRRLTIFPQTKNVIFHNNNEKYLFIE